MWPKERIVYTCVYKYDCVEALKYYVPAATDHFTVARNCYVQVQEKSSLDYVHTLII